MILVHVFLTEPVLPVLPVTHHNIHTTPVNHDIYQTIHHHHYDNSTPIQHTQNMEHHATQAAVIDVSPKDVVDEVHYHRHYGNRDFTEDLGKRKKQKKKDFCNISEHEELVGEVV